MKAKLPVPTLALYGYAEAQQRVSLIAFLTATTASGSAAISPPRFDQTNEDRFFILKEKAHRLFCAERLAAYPCCSF
jgi:hypothetical protein